MTGETRAGGWGRVLVGVLLLGPLGACREEKPPLVGSETRVRFSRQELAFPGTYVGVAREGEVRLVSAGRSPVRVTWGAVPEPFVVEGLPERVGPSEEATVEVLFAPEAPGTFSATVVGTEEGGVRSVRRRPKQTCPAAASAWAARAAPGPRGGSRPRPGSGCGTCR